jgi:ferric-dicitrate binding protein FerR (iron transport regulator)
LSAKPCPRLWQAEAHFDGYLAPSDAASFDRHVGTCAECSAERTALARLQNVARRMPVLEVSPLRRRALHNEILGRANKALVRQGRPLLARSWIWLSFAACALGFLLVVFLRSQRPVVDSGVTEPSYRLVAAPGSRWHVAQPGSALRLAVEEGTFTISVNKLKTNQRFALDLPDGELEVRGTRFTVRLGGQHTLRVAVEEGHVALRFSGHDETILGPGDEWPIVALVDPGPPPAADSNASANHSASRRGPPVAASNVSSVRNAHAQPSRYGRNGSSLSDSTASPPGTAAVIAASDGGIQQPTAGEDFARAMSMFSRGDYGTAEQLLDAFETRYPGSSHTEDVLFLRALTRSRRGDQQGASRLAHEYLRRYPAGFRTKEAERMAHELLKELEPAR